MTGLSGKITFNKGLLTKWKKSCEQGMLSRRNLRPGYPMEFKFDSIEHINEYFDNEKLECLLCGRNFKSLGNHLVIHEISVREYQEKYGLPYSKGLWGNTRKEHFSKMMTIRHKTGSISTDHLTPLNMKRMNEKANKGERSEYKILQDNLKMQKAIKASALKRSSRTHCKYGHPYETGKRKCQICNTENKRKLEGHLPREIALKTLVDSVCSKCGDPVKVIKTGKRKDQRCGKCAKEYMRQYDSSRDKEKKRALAKKNYLKRKQKKEGVNETT